MTPVENLWAIGLAACALVVITAAVQPHAKPARRRSAGGGAPALKSSHEQGERQMASKNQTQHKGKHLEIVKGLARSLELMDFATDSGVKVKKVIVSGDEPQLVFEGDDA